MSRGGRPRDSFWWDLVKWEGGRLQCTYCGKEFKGGVSRIKLHLSCRGGNIGPCKSVPKEIKDKAEEELQGGTCVGEGNRDKASKPSPMKRARYTSVGGDGHGGNVAETGGTSSLAAGPTSSHNQVSSSSSFHESPSNLVELVKFLMSRNVAVDVFKDSHFWSMLASVAHPGIQSWLQLLDNSAIIQKSLSNFELDMNQYMEEVKKSWKTTGCTLMLYDLSDGKGKFSADEKYNLVAGFYCPKGFIFVEVDLPVKCKCCYACELDYVLNTHLNLSTDDVIRIIDHTYYRQHECQYQEHGLPDLYQATGCVEKDFACCLQHYFKELWKGIYESSAWLRNLIEKAETLYENTYEFLDLDGKLKRTSKLKSTAIQAKEGNFVNCLSRLRSIMDGRGELVQLLETDTFQWDDGGKMTPIIKDEEFWSDVKNVVEALTPFLQFAHLTETLLPNVAYLEEALEEGERALKTYYEREPLKFVGILDGFKDWLKLIDGDLYETNGCLNPVFCMSERNLLDPDIGLDINIERMEGLVKEEERERLEDEVSRYLDKSSNPFLNISRSEYKAYHPVKLWDKYGSNFPVLHKCATKILSQPVTCLCEQVEKCMSRLRGSDNLILRLNAMMKEEFDKLGNEMYQPVDVDSIFKKHEERIIA